MAQIKCDQCSAEFELQLQVNQLPDGVERAFFVCPECGAEYTAYYTDDGIRTNQFKSRRLQEKYKTAVALKDRKQAERLFRQIERTKKETGSAMRDLRERIEG